MTSEPLKPCPFCGGDRIEHLQTLWDGEHGEVRCFNCKVEIKKETVEEAMKLWNTRQRD